MSDPTYPAFPVFAFLGFTVSLIPLPWHLHAWNAGTCVYMIWTALGCLNAFINSIVWHGNAINWAPVWCDISSRLMIGINVAIPAASLCINRRLYKIATMRTVTISHAQKRRALFIDLAIGLGIPVVEMALEYIVQGHRFDIYEDIGCYPFVYNTPPAYPLVVLWPSVIGLISAVYCILSLKAFFKRRAEFQEFLSSNPSLTVNRYFRLMALATTELLCTTPISAYFTYLNITTDGISPWKGWADTHFDFSAVHQIPSIIWRSNEGLALSLEMNRWLLPVCAFVFFGFFGLAEEARKHYGAAYWNVARVFGVSKSKGSPLSSFASKPTQFPLGSSGTLPIFITRSSHSATHDSSTSTFDPHDEKLVPSLWTENFSSPPSYDLTPPTPRKEKLAHLPSTTEYPTRRRDESGSSETRLSISNALSPHDLIVIAI